MPKPDLVVLDLASPDIIYAWLTRTARFGGAPIVAVRDGDHEDALEVAAAALRSPGRRIRREMRASFEHATDVSSPMRDRLRFPATSIVVCR